MLRKTKSFYNEDLTRQEKKTRDDAEGRRRFFSDRNILSFSPFLSDERYSSLSSKEDSNREERKNRTRGPHIAVTFRTCFGQHAHGLARSQRHRPGGGPASPFAISPPDSDANRGQLWRCVPSPYPRLTTSTSIEITLIYCGTERLARSIIRLSPVGR